MACIVNVHTKDWWLCDYLGLAFSHLAVLFQMIGLGSRKVIILNKERDGNDWPEVTISVLDPNTSCL